MAYQIKSHPVDAVRIADLQPLVGPNTAVMSPDFGLLLVLENGQKHKWLSEKNAPAPAAGDWLVHDEALHVDFIVAADQFSKLFRESRS